MALDKYLTALLVKPREATNSPSIIPSCSFLGLTQCISLGACTCALEAQGRSIRIAGCRSMSRGYESHDMNRTGASGCKWSNGRPCAALQLEWVSNIMAHRLRRPEAG